ncbi:ATP-binding protein [Synoicihabitans lomoniglobus]|uniref:histidine kinase n=1 Tax=Synoicihabitans lomoniglobus TaxID=2909285 RepID=A0AAE9ZX48_9BACT|nr:ATP-binding protein [Opitutaceae bacterium LMO-M01]WED64709.1 ATP-binding protein [Opitutaceae bacterium LMO-M01]
MSPPDSTGPIDLSNCDREPIHIPGSIQSHAVLFALREPDWLVEQVSSNVSVVLPEAPVVLGQKLDALLPAEVLAAWREESAREPINQNPLYLPPLPAPDGGPPFEALLHRHNTVLILELERWKDGEALKNAPSLGRFQRTLKLLSEAKSLTDFCQHAATSVREFIGFDRVMVYRFADDDSGHVIAESRRDDLESYLGLHYPASDIPKQARDLFRRSPVRLNPDIYYQPVPLDPPLHPRTDKPLDMSHCVTRSMSPIHVEYLKNMGVGASMSLSIVVEGRLWGLFACHHYRPRYVTHGARIACEFLAQTLSLQTAEKERLDQAHYASSLQTAREQLTGLFEESNDLPTTLQEAAPILGELHAGASALLLADAVHPIGAAPSETAIRQLGAWLSEHQPTSVNATTSLTTWVPEIADAFAPYSGVLAARLCRNPPAYLFWFRVPEVQIVNWAGDPTKPVESGPLGDRLTPRKSFALWQEEVRDRSLPWHAVEVDAARALRHVVLEAMARHTERLIRLQVELENRNQDLESFAYIASHDLKEPLRGLRNYARYLHEDHDAELSPEARQKLQTVQRLGLRMEQLIDALLHYSRVGRTEPRREDVDLNEILAQSRELITARLEERPTDIHVPRPLPHVTGDPVLLTEVFANLISNAVKYNDKSQPRIEIGWIAPPDGPLRFRVQDNGIGIDPANQHAVFRIFKRLHGRDEFGGGVGIGLTIVHSIITRLGGHIWLDSIPGKGTTFHFTLAPADPGGIGSPAPSADAPSA